MPAPRVILDHYGRDWTVRWSRDPHPFAKLDFACRQLQQERFLVYPAIPRDVLEAWPEAKRQEFYPLLRKRGLDEASDAELQHMLASSESRFTACVQHYFAFQHDAEVINAVEWRLFSDARVDLTAMEFGPFQICPNPAYDPERPQQSAFARLALRVGLNAMSLRTDYGVEYVDAAHDVAALLSLCLGVRVREVAGDDAPAFARAVGSAVLGRVSGPADTDHLRLLNGETGTLFTRAPKASADALVRAARFYRDAIWVAETDPSLAWLWLVGAVEAAANRHRRRDPPLELEKTLSSLPDDVAAHIRRCDPEAITGIVAYLASNTRVKEKFLDFLKEFFPPPPASRPVADFRLLWEYPAIERKLKVIYDYRSRFLHDGLPFPEIMLAAPSYPGAENYYRIAQRGGPPVIKEAVLTLNAFELLVRPALLLWWRSLLA